MSESYRIGLKTSASPHDLAGLFRDPVSTPGDKQVVEASLSDVGQHVFMHRSGGVPLEWEHLGGSGIPDVEIHIDHALSRQPESVRADQQSDVVLSCIQRSDVSAGAFEDPEQVCFLYWGPEGVVVNSDPFAARSQIGKAVRSKLNTAGISYSEKVLDLYCIRSDDDTFHTTAGLFDG